MQSEMKKKLLNPHYTLHNAQYFYSVRKLAELLNVEVSQVDKYLNSKP